MWESYGRKRGLVGENPGMVRAWDGHTGRKAALYGVLWVCPFEPGTVMPVMLQVATESHLFMRTVSNPFDLDALLGCPARSMEASP